MNGADFRPLEDESTMVRRVNLWRNALVSRLGPGVAGACAALLLTACVGGPDVGAGSDLVVTEDGIGTTPVSPARAAALAEMRTELAAINSTLPAESPAQQTMRLAARDEPRSLAEVEAIQAELALIAKRRAGASPSEVAALEVRAGELRRLAAAAQAGAAPQ